MKGIVKFFNKGWGFITGDDGKDYFCHYSEIKKDGFKELFENEEVEFDPAEDAQARPRAENVHALNPEVKPTSMPSEKTDKTDKNKKIDKNDIKFI